MPSQKTKKTSSPYIVVRRSSIHSWGIFARKDILRDTRIIEYVGERITKKESDRRAQLPLQRNKENSEHGAVYIFELNKRYDIDGYVPYNTARLINHSCSPNCEAVRIHGHIWIVAVRDIKKGEEITYNYGYNLDDYHEHPCYCGSDNCVGYILDAGHWKKLKDIQKKLARKEKRRQKKERKKEKKAARKSGKKDGKGKKKKKDPSGKKKDKKSKKK